MGSYWGSDPGLEAMALGEIVVEGFLGLEVEVEAGLHFEVERFYFYFESGFCWGYFYGFEGVF